jgi:hypothetical protein
MFTVAMGEDVISSKIVAIKDHNNDRRFGDIMEEPL